MNLIEQMFEMQAALNDATVADWRTANLPWYRAIWLEAGELQDSFGWKWWKQQIPNHDNNVVELVDIFHFIMSGMIVDAASYDKGVEEIAELIIMQPYESISLEDINHRVDAIADNALNTEYGLCLVDVMAIWKGYYKLTLEDLYLHYMTKNVLNHFRQENGYKDGSYKKIWNGVEDNVVAFDIAKSIDISDTFVDDLKEKLQVHYASL
jgi:dimeric dUTPase (all-alpha-NTP-PPase superfamily)